MSWLKKYKGGGDVPDGVSKYPKKESIDRKKSKEFSYIPDTRMDNFPVIHPFFGFNKTNELEIRPSTHEPYSKKMLENIESKEKWRKAKKEVVKPVMKTLDVATDLMQLGNFIPHPIAQAVGKTGNVLGAIIDGSQAIDDYASGDYNSALVNGSSMMIPTLISKYGYTRDMYNTVPGSFADKITSYGTRNGSYIPLEAYSNLKNNPVINKAISANKGLLGSLGTETVVDSYGDGGWLTSYKEGGKLDWNEESKNPGKISNLSDKGVSRGLTPVQPDIQNFTPYALPFVPVDLKKTHPKAEKLKEVIDAHNWLPKGTNEILSIAGIPNPASAINLVTYPITAAANLTEGSDYYTTGNPVGDYMNFSGDVASVLPFIKGKTKITGSVNDRSQYNLLNIPSEVFAKDYNNDLATSVKNDLLERVKSEEGKKRLKDLSLDISNLEKVDIKTTSTDHAYYGFADNVYLNKTIPKNLIKGVTRHEFEHAIQNRNMTSIDKNLEALELKKDPISKSEYDKIKAIKNNILEEKVDSHNLYDYLSNDQNATDYFTHGSEGREKSAFLSELQQYLVDKGHVSHPYDNITPDIVKGAFIDNKVDKDYPLRIFNIMKPNEKNFNLLSENLNKLLTVVPPTVIGTSTYLNSKKEKTEWLNKYNK